jgi:hypothetical protein
MTTKDLDRFMRKVDIIPGGCWEWRGYRHKKSGYGSFHTGGHVGPAVYAHKFSYEHQEGGVSYPLELDHTCRNRGCVKPGHLEAVTHKENVLRGASPSAANAQKTYCLRGHIFSIDNILNSPSNANRRQCRLCKNIRQNAKRAELRKV